MIDYQNGKIYRIVSDNTDKVYIGSSSHKYLAQRWATHNCDYKHGRQYTTAWELFDAGNCRIELIEKFPCNSRKELTLRENYWIDNTPNCVNKNRAYSTPEEKRQRQRERQRDQYRNDPKYLEYKRNYYQKNREKCIAATQRAIAKRKLKEEYEAKIAAM